jgi:Xaa-Pro aminopeptidase
MKKDITLSKDTVKQNIQKLKTFLASHQLDGMYISSFDQYLNEYVPLADNHRYYITNFTGSMAEVLVPKDGKVRLYVDGRYHEQADLEVDHEMVEVVKCVAGTGEQLLADIKSLKLKRTGYEADRTALGFLKKISEVTSETIGFSKGELSSIIEFFPLPGLKEIQFVERPFRGRDTLEKTAQIIPSESEAIYLTALDSIAWITNCRGYHLPFASAFCAKALVTKNKVYIYLMPGTPVSEKAKKEAGLEFVYLHFNDLPRELERLQNTLHLTSVKYDPNMLNCADFSMLLKVFGVDRLHEKLGGVYDYQSIKEPVELEQFEASFKRADQAIYKTIKWAKESIKAGKKITELDLYHETEKKYQAEGSKELSFNTISGVGANASIVHYGSPSDEKIILEDDMILLDSGGYFDGGFATDTTRTFAGSNKVKMDPKKIEIYTLTLKGLLAAQSAVFPEGTKGMVIDGLARNAMRKRGYDYSHGTGHGVGIGVHEPGVRLSAVSTLPLKPGQVVSIEPGIYLPGFGGVRLENIVYVIKHPSFPGMLCFKPLTTIGFDPALVDLTLLNEEERKILDDYESECEKRGTSLRKLAQTL